MLKAVQMFMPKYIGSEVVFQGNFMYCFNLMVNYVVSEVPVINFTSVINNMQL